MNSDQETLRDLVATQARRFEKRIYIESGRERFSYGDVDDRTDRVATGLSHLGLHVGDRVAILLSNRPELVFFFLGAPKIGIIPVPIDPACSQDEVSSTLRHSGALAIVTESSLSGFLQDLPEIRHQILIDTPAFAESPFYGLAGGSVLRFWPDLSATDAAVISYSQGRKPVVLTHRNLLSNCMQMLQPFRIHESDRFLCELPLSWTAAQVLLLLAPWAAGATCILREAFSHSILQDIQESHATVLAGVPRLYEMMAGSPQFAEVDLSSLRLAICSAGPVGEELLRQFEDRHDALIVEGYGPVEATCLCCVNPYTGLRKPGSLGIPLPGLECCIVDENARELPPGETGEIVVRGPNVMREYYRDPEATEKALRAGWLHTGDLGYIDRDGYYYLSHHRADELLRTHNRDKA